MPEFLDEERVDDWRIRRAFLVRWGLAFLGLFLFVVGAFWWSGSAVKYGTTRVRGEGTPTYEVTGVVTDSLTHRPVPWVRITTDFVTGSKFFATTADANGVYQLMTMAEPHRLVFSANGYRTASFQVGKQWFSWLPRGSEKKNVELAQQ